MTVRELHDLLHPNNDWEHYEHLFPGCSAAYDRDLLHFADNREGPRIQVEHGVLSLYVGDSKSFSPPVDSWAYAVWNGRAWLHMSGPRFWPSTPCP